MSADVPPPQIPLQQIPTPEVSAPQIEYSRQPEGGRLRCVFHAEGVTIIDEPLNLSGGRRPNHGTIVVLVKRGLITVTKPHDRQAAPYRFLKDRHVRRMLVIPPRLYGLLGRGCVRLWVSDLHIDLFQGGSMAELTWVDQIIRFEIHKYYSNRESPR